jgi:hypothetical protein
VARETEFHLKLVAAEVRARYRRLVPDYATLLPDLGHETPQLRARVEDRLTRARKLGTQVP